MKINRDVVLLCIVSTWIGLFTSAVAQTPATVSADQSEVVPIGSGNATFSGSTVSPDESCYTKTGKKRFTWSYGTLVGTPATGVVSSSPTLQIPKATAGETNVKVKLEEEYKHNDTGIKVWVSAGISTTDVVHNNVQVYPDVPNELWYFSEASSPLPYPTTHTSTIRGGGSRSFTWEATAGSQKVTLTPEQEGRKCKIETKQKSNTENDVTIQVSWGEEIIQEFDLTINTAKVCNFSYVEDSTLFWSTVLGNVFIGFLSEYGDQVLDEYDEPMPGVFANESFGMKSDDWYLNNWSNFVQGNNPTDENGLIIDKYSCVDYYGTSYPWVLGPGDADAGVKVWHKTQTYKVGSLTSGDGKFVKAHTLQFYRGKARQNL